MNGLKEIEVSALLDNELAHREVLEVVDHLVDSPDLRCFYRQVRSLDLALEEGRVSDLAGELPARLWQQIEDRSAGSQGAVLSASGRFRRLPAWMLTAVAAAVIAVGAWMGGRHLQPSPSSSEGTVLVRYEGEAGQMTDQRFVDLTAELLRADRRYQKTMNELLTAVREHQASFEGSVEGTDPLQDSGLRRAVLTELDTEQVQPRVWD